MTARKTEIPPPPQLKAAPRRAKPTKKMQASAAALDLSDKRLASLRRAVLAAINVNGHDLTLRQIGILSFLSEERGPSEIAALMDIAPPMVSKNCERLIGLHLIGRKADPNDRRRVTLYRLKAGNDLMEKLLAAMP